ncbi:hypothetical protein X564_14600 [Pseudoalteromonas agarivorans]|nr:hypothetical protein X564_14600 [Pseudoalteromonas agarivorans]
MRVIKFFIKLTCKFKSEKARFRKLNFWNYYFYLFFIRGFCKINELTFVIDL